MQTNIVAMDQNLRRTRPCLPLELGRRLHGLTPERAKTMTLTTAERETLTKLIPAYRAYLEPGPRHEISGLLTKLRAHYFVPDLPDALGEAIANDWADDFGSYPLWVVKEACDRYRRSEGTRAPRPADLIAFCEGWLEDERREMSDIEMALSSKPGTSEPPPRVTPEQVGAIIDRMGMREDMDRIAAQKTRALRSEG